MGVKTLKPSLAKSTISFKDILDGKISLLVSTDTDVNLEPVFAFLVHVIFEKWI